MRTLRRRLAPNEPLQRSVTVVVLCALASVAAVGLGLVFARYAPTWTQIVMVTLLVANAIPILLFLQHRWRWDGYMGTVVTVVGIYNIGVWGLLRTFSEFGRPFQGGWIGPILGIPDFAIGSVIRHPEVLVFAIILTGVLMGTIGIWFLDLDVYRGVKFRSTIGVMTGVLGLIAVLQYLSVGVSLVALIWATGTGIFLLPVVVVGAIRWGRTAGKVTRVMIGVLVMGIVILSASPLWTDSFFSTLLLCSEPISFSSSLQHSANLMTLEFSGFGGCNAHRLELKRVPLQVGAVITAVGAAGTGLDSVT